MGVCLHVQNYNDADWTNSIRPRLRELGVRYVRDGLEHMDNAALAARFQSLNTDCGIKLLAVCTPYGNDQFQGDLSGIVPRVKQALPFLLAVEGPNEPDLFWAANAWASWCGGTTDRWAQILYYQDKMYDLIKADAATKDIPVTTFALAFGENADHFLNANPKHDVLAWHHYNGPYKPNPWQLQYERDRYPSSQPAFLTEHGYKMQDVSEYTQMKYDVRNLALFFNWNQDVKTFLYVFGPDYEDYGLFRDINTVRPVYTALKNVIGLLADSTAFTPGSLDITYAGNMADVGNVLLQKQNGDFYLLLWLNVDSYTGDSSRSLTLDFSAVKKVEEYRCDSSGKYVYSKITDGAKSIGVAVPDSLLILKITPGTGNGSFSGYYKLKSKASGKCLDNRASTADGSTLQQWDEADTDSQLWNIVDVGNGYYNLVAKASRGKVLDYGWSTANGSKLIQWSNNGCDAQRWKISAVSPAGYYKLVGKANGNKALDNGWSPTNGFEVIQWDDSGNDAQGWQMVLVSNLPPVTLAHRYSFTDSSNTGADVIDSVGGPAWSGAVFNGARTRDGQLWLDGISAYAQLPPGVISNMDAVTIEAWASFKTPGTWAELYAFGIQGSPTGPGGNMIAFIPHSGFGDYRMSINDGAPGSSHEEVAGVSGNLDNAANVHLVAVYNPFGGLLQLYTNGVLVAQLTNLTAQLAGVYSVTNWLGRSLWNDPYLNGSIDEFRVWNGVMSAEQVAANDTAGPNALPRPRLQVGSAGSPLTLSWPAWGGGSRLYTAPTPQGPWTLAGSTSVSDGHTVTVTLPAQNGGAAFYRLGP